MTFLAAFQHLPEGMGSWGARQKKAGRTSTLTPWGPHKQGGEEIWRTWRMRPFKRAGQGFAKRQPSAPSMPSASCLWTSRTSWLFGGSINPDVVMPCSLSLFWLTLPPRLSPPANASLPSGPNLWPISCHLLSSLSLFPLSGHRVSDSLGSPVVR